MSLEVLWICTIELFVHEIALSALRPLRRAWTGEEILAKLPGNNPITVQPILRLVITLSFTIPYLPNHTMYKLTWLEPNWTYSIVSISFVSFFFFLFSTCLPYLLRNRPVPSSISLLHTSNQPTILLLPNPQSKPHYPIFIIWVDRTRPSLSLFFSCPVSLPTYGQQPKFPFF